jgi:hypothetical protein
LTFRFAEAALDIDLFGFRRVATRLFNDGTWIPHDFLALGNSVLHFHKLIIREA